MSGAWMRTPGWGRAAAPRLRGLQRPVTGADVSALLAGRPWRDQSRAAPVLADGHGGGLLQTCRRSRFGDLARLDVALASSLRREQPHDTVVGEWAECVDQGVDKITVVVAPPQQHHV